MADFHKKLTIGQDLGSVLIRGLRESTFLVYLGVSLLLLISLLSFNLEDAGWTHGGSRAAIHNAAGLAGAWLADFFLSLFGITAFLFPFILAGYGYVIFRHTRGKRAAWLDTALQWLGFSVAVIAATAIADRFMIRPRILLPEGYGGILGREVSEYCFQAFGTTGMTILLVTLLLAGVSLFTGLSWVWVLDGAGRVGLYLAKQLGPLFRFPEWKPWTKTDSESEETAEAVSGILRREAEPLIRHKLVRETQKSTMLKSGARDRPCDDQATEAAKARGSSLSACRRAAHARSAQ